MSADTSVSTAEGAAAVAGEVQREQQHLTTASQELAAAGQHADRVIRQAQGAGLGRVAEGVHEIKRRLEQVTHVLGQADGPLNSAVTAAAAVTVQTSPKQAMASLTEATGGITAAESPIRAAMAQLRQVESWTMQVLDGGNPGPLLNLLGRARKSISAAGNSGLAAKRHAEQTIERARQVGDSSGN